MDIDLKVIAKAFPDKEQQNVVLNIYKHAEDAAEKRIEQKLQDSGFDSRVFGLDKEAQAKIKYDRAVDLMDRVWKSNGRLNDMTAPMTFDEYFGMEKDIHRKLMKDAVFASTDLPQLMPRMIEQQVREAIEPNLVVTPLFQKVRFPGRGTTISFPSTGAIEAADVGEASEYPSRKLEFAGHVVATIGKSGVGIQITEEAVRYSLYDVVSMHINAAGRALARWKEYKAVQELLGNGTTIFDNTDPSKRSTTGRDAAGTHNGTLTATDFLYAWSELYNTNGYVPNTIIMNPFGWLVFAQDSTMRQFFMQNGGGQLLQLPQGQPGRATQWNIGGLFNRTTPNNSTSSNPETKNIATSYAMPPDIWPGSVRIIVSPFVPYNAANQTTDLILCDSNEVGVLVEDEAVVMDEWNDLARDVRHMKFRERYGFATMNEGLGIGYLKGISIKRGFDFSDRISVQLTGLSFTGDLTEDDPFAGNGTSYSGNPAL